MAALTVALLGTPRTGAHQVAGLLRHSLERMGLQASLTVVVELAALPVALRDFDLLLLMGMEPLLFNPIPFSPQEAMEELARETVAHRSMRNALAQANTGYQVLYGGLDARADQALKAAISLLPRDKAFAEELPLSEDAARKPWRWPCDKCSDPACERRLFTALLDQRAGLLQDPNRLGFQQAF